MPISADLLEILCCPVSKTPLERLTTDKLRKLNASIEAGDALYVDGGKVTQPIDDALITTDMKVIYAIEDGIPILLGERGIGTAQFKDF